MATLTVPTVTKAAGVPLSARTNTPISTKELERRWAAIRAKMAEQRIDVLVMQNNNDGMGGYVKYFTDLPAQNGYPTTVVFPYDDRMTTISQANFGTDQALPAEGDGLRRGVKRVLGAPVFVSAGYSLAYDVELTEKALEPYRAGTIGMVGLGTLPFSLVNGLMHGRCSAAKFIDATELVDAVKCIKSNEELALIRGTAAVQDKAIGAALKAVEPGKRDIDIAALAEYTARELGSEQGLFLVSSYQPGHPTFWLDRHNQNRVLQKGDRFHILVETNGPGGFWTEINRPCVIGKATEQMKDEFAFLMEARKFTLGTVKDGASCKDIWDAYNAFVKKNGRPEERRLYFHGQGYDLVERPLVRFDEPMRIAKNMNFACHPTFFSGGLFNAICDNFVINEKGVPERIHKFPEQLFELG